MLTKELRMAVFMAMHKEARIRLLDISAKNLEAYLAGNVQNKVN